AEENSDASNSDCAITADRANITSSTAQTNPLPVSQNSHVSLGNRRFPSRSHPRRTRQKTTPKSDLGALFGCQPTVPYQCFPLEDLLEPVLSSCLCIARICTSRLH